MKQFKNLLLICSLLFITQISKAQMKLENMGYQETMDWIKWKVQTKGSVWFSKEWYLKSAELDYSGRKVTYSFEKFTIEEDGDFNVENTYKYTYKFDLQDVETISLYNKDENKVLGITIVTNNSKVNLTGTHKLRDKYRATTNSKNKKISKFVIYIDSDEAERFMKYINHARDQIEIKNQ